MRSINIETLSLLVKDVTNRRALQLMVGKFNKSYNPKVKFADFDLIIHTGNLINDFQIMLLGEEKQIRTSQKDEIFFNRELKLFCWTLILLCHCKGFSLNKMLSIPVTDISAIFPHKSTQFILFERQCIYYSRSINSIPWHKNQIALLNKIIKENLAGQWKKRAYLLFCLSDGRYFRTFQSCRQSWISHLNPSIKKGKWTAAQDSQLMEYIKIHGLKWSAISKLKGSVRSEHSIKNRYNSLLNKLRKKVPGINLEDIHQCHQHWIRFFRLHQHEEQGLEASLQGSNQQANKLSSHQPQLKEVEMQLEKVDQIQAQSYPSANPIQSSSPQQLQHFSWISLDRLEIQFKQLMSWRSQGRHLKPLASNENNESSNLFTDFWFEPTNDYILDSL